MAKCIHCDKKFRFLEDKLNKKETQQLVYILKNFVGYDLVGHTSDWEMYKRWSERKEYYQEITDSMIEKIGKNNICESCFEQHVIENYPDAMFLYQQNKLKPEKFEKWKKYNTNYVKSYHDEIERIENSSVTCYWCKKLFLKKNTFEIPTHNKEVKQCSECRRINENLTSEKYDELKNKKELTERKLDRLRDNKFKMQSKLDSAKWDAGIDSFASALSNEPSSSELQYYESVSEKNYLDIAEEYDETLDQLVQLGNDVRREEENLMRKHFEKNSTKSDSYPENEKIQESKALLSDEEALKILKRRYVVGEITLEKFNQLKDVLE